MRGARRSFPTWATAGLLVVGSLPGTARAEGVVRPLGMQDAIRMALDRNPTFLVAREEIRRAQALVEEARAQSLPTLMGTGTYLRLDSPRVFQGIVSQPENQVNLTAVLSVPLVSPRTWALWSHAHDNVQVASATAFDTRRTIAVATAHAYLSVFTQKRLLEADIQARETARAHFGFAHVRLVTGAGNRLDEVRAGQQVSADNALVQSARAAVVRAEEALGVLVGSDVPVDAAEEPVLADAPSLAQAMELATTRRSDVLAAKEREVAAHHVKRDNWTEYSPFLGGTFSPFYQDPPTSLLPQTGWEAELVLTVPFYDGGLRYGLGKERAALEREAGYAFDGTVRQARSDVRAAYETLERSVDSFKEAADAARLADEALALATQAYQAGALTNLDVIDAELTARDARIQAELAADTERQARLDLLADTGQFP